MSVPQQGDSINKQEKGDVSRQKMFYCNIFEDEHEVAKFAFRTSRKYKVSKVNIKKILQLFYFFGCVDLTFSIYIFWSKLFI